LKCLVVQTAYLGDVVLTMPLLGLLRGLPSVRSLVALTTPAGAEFLRGQRALDRIMIYDKRGGDSGLGGFLRTVRDVRHCGFGAAVVPHRSFRSALLPLLALIPERVGFDESGGRWLLTEHVPYRSLPHEAERVASLALSMGATFPEGRLDFRLRIPEAGVEELALALASSGVSGSEPLITAAPGSRWATKRWPAERFGTALEALCRELGARPVVTGSRAERESGRLAAMSAGPGAVDLTGRLSVSGLLALAARSELVLSNDSAAAHIAAGVGTPTVTVFGPTVPSQGFAPYSERAVVVQARLDCRPCGRHGANRCRRGTLECMTLVSARDVVDAALELIGARSRARDPAAAPGT